MGRKRDSEEKASGLPESRQYFWILVKQSGQHLTIPGGILRAYSVSIRHPWVCVLPQDKCSSRNLKLLFLSFFLSSKLVFCFPSCCLSLCTFLFSDFACS